MLPQVRVIDCGLFRVEFDAGITAQLRLLQRCIEGSVVTWGGPDKGGNSDEVRDQLSGGVREVVGNASASAAVKEDGTVVTWGGAGFDSDSD